MAAAKAKLEHVLGKSTPLNSQIMMENALPSLVKANDITSQSLERETTDWTQTIYKVTNLEEKVYRKLLLSASQFQLVVSKCMIIEAAVSKTKMR